MPSSSPSHAARRVAALAAAAAALLSAGTAQAQFARTGGASTPCAAGPAGCDANWSVRWFGTGDGTNGSANTLGMNGVLPNAALVTSPPSPPWAPNTATQQWIGVSPSASVSTPLTGNNASNYRYFFQTTFTGSPFARDLSVAIGWDNKLVGAIVGDVTINADGSFALGAGATSLIGAASPSAPFLGGRSGFCRDGDGAFPGAQFADCLYTLNAIVPATKATTLTFVVQGDGTTDGLLVGTPTAATVTPEPSSYALLGGGLLALAGAVRRRRAARA